MIQHPAIIALVGSSLATATLTLAAGAYGIRIDRKWDLASGSELQLTLERKTYLISLIMAYVLAFQLIALFLFIHTADNIHNLFTGAMCAAGSLAANGFGYPLLLLKTGNCVLAGTWLICNRIDNYGYDYPLIRQKYRFLALIALLLAVETVLHFFYFGGLRADVITSCCGSLFGAGRTGIAGDIASMPAKPVMAAFAALAVLYFACGARSLATGRSWLVFAALSLLFFPAAIETLIAAVSLYFYELPTHHCPFCILQKEYGYVGYILYGCLLGGIITGAGAGVAEFARRRESIAESSTRLQKNVAAVSMILNGIFMVICLVEMVTSPLRLLS
jgi:hypothetical protein